MGRFSQPAKRSKITYVTYQPLVKHDKGLYLGSQSPQLVVDDSITIRNALFPCPLRQLQTHPLLQVVTADRITCLRIASCAQAHTI